MFDQVHAPRPLTPLSQEILMSGLTEGFSAALKEVGYPLGICFRPVNYYCYCTLTPHAESTRAAQSDAIAQLIPRLGMRWETEWLPSILPGLERLRALDYAGMSDDALIATLHELRRDLVARWRIHGYLLFSYQAASTFDDFYTELFHPADSMEPYMLLNGFATRSSDASRGLWRLSRDVRRSPLLMRLFAETAPSSLLVSLDATEAGRAFVSELRAYLDEYGWRSDAIMELAEPMWREDLAIPLNALQGLIGRDDTEDPDARLQRIAERRERLVEHARARLGDPAQRARFAELYEQARGQVLLDEDHNFYIDQMGNVGLRLPILEIGRRLVRYGCLDQVDDVFMLTTHELASGLAGVNYHHVVDMRRAEMARWATLTPPATLGEVPPEGDIDPFLAAIMKLDAPPVPREHTATVIRGTPASPGTARGRAKVARSLEEASTVEPGQILVCEMTLPPWGVLFSTIGGVVADTGGVLSHCATVAREYGIPCVVGTIVGTTTIQDGALLVIDGALGEVRILEQARRAR
jgi:pyruvate,water dikinase